MSRSTRVVASRPRDPPPTATRPLKSNQVIHYCVTNMPGAVPRTSTLALSNVTLPYALALAEPRTGRRPSGAIRPWRRESTSSTAMSPTPAWPRRSTCRIRPGRGCPRRHLLPDHAWPVSRKGSSTVMEEQVERFLGSLQSERQFSRNTIAAYRNDLQQFIAWLGAPPPDDQVVAISSWSDLTADHLLRVPAAPANARLRGIDDCPQNRRPQVVQYLAAGGRHRRRRPRHQPDVARGWTSTCRRRSPRTKSALLLEQPTPRHPGPARRASGISPCSRCSTTPACASASWSRSTWTISISRPGRFECQGKAGRSRIVPLGPVSTSGGLEVPQRCARVPGRGQFDLAVRQSPRRAPDPPGVLADPEVLRRTRRDRGHHAAHAAPLPRRPRPRPWRRTLRYPEATRPRQHLHHPGVPRRSCHGPNGDGTGEA